MNEINEVPRAYTEKEVTDKLIGRLSMLTDYWYRQPISEKEKLEGLIFSVLTTLDGCSGELPQFKLVPNPHESDMEHNKNNGENWFDPKIELTNISLHDLWTTHRKTK
jgi:hypothetical protein